MIASERKNEPTIGTIRFDRAEFKITAKNETFWFDALGLRLEDDTIQLLIDQLDNPTIRQCVAAEIEAHLSSTREPILAKFFAFYSDLEHDYAEILRKHEAEYKYSNSKEAKTAKTQQLKAFCSRKDVCKAYLLTDVKENLFYQFIVTPQGGLLDAIARVNEITVVVCSEFDEHEGHQYFLTQFAIKHDPNLDLGNCRILAPQKNGYYSQLTLTTADYERFCRTLGPRNEDICLVNELETPGKLDYLINQCLLSLASQNEEAFHQAYKHLNEHDLDNHILRRYIRSECQVPKIDSKSAILMRARAEKETLPRYNFLSCREFYQDYTSLRIFFSHIIYCLDPNDKTKKKEFAKSLVAHQSLLRMLSKESNHREFLPILQLCASDPELHETYAQALSVYSQHAPGQLWVVIKELLVFAENYHIRVANTRIATPAAANADQPQGESKDAKSVESKVPDPRVTKLPLPIYERIASFDPGARNFHSFALTSKVHLASFTNKFNNPNPAIEKVIDDKLSLVDLYPTLKVNKDVIKKRLILLVNMKLITLLDIQTHSLVPLLFLAIHNNQDYPIISQKSDIRTHHQEILAHIQHTYSCALASNKTFESFIEERFDKKGCITVQELMGVVAEHILQVQNEIEYANAFGENFKFLRHACGQPGFNFRQLANFEFKKEERDLLFKLLPCSWFNFTDFFENIILPNKAKQNRYKVNHFLMRLINSRQHVHLQLGLIEFNDVKEKIFGELKSLEQSSHSIEDAISRFGQEQIACCERVDLTAGFGVCLLPNFSLSLNSGGVKDFKEFIDSNKKQIQNIGKRKFNVRTDLDVVRFEIMQFNYDEKNEATSEFKEFARLVTKILDQYADEDFEHYPEMLKMIQFYQPLYVKKHINQFNRSLKLKDAVVDLESKEPASNKQLVLKVLMLAVERRAVEEKDDISRCCTLLGEVTLRHSGILEKMSKIDMPLYSRVIGGLAPEMPAPTPNEADEAKFDDREAQSDTEAEEPSSPHVNAEADDPWGDFKEDEAGFDEQTHSDIEAEPDSLSVDVEGDDDPWGSEAKDDALTPRRSPRL